MSTASALSRLETGLEALLSALGNAPAAEFTASEAAFDELAAAFEAVRAALESDPASRAGHEPSVERCLRLYAVAMGLLAARRDVLVAERTVCVQASRRLERLNSNASSGASCDLSA